MKMNVLYGIALLLGLYNAKFSVSGTGWAKKYTLSLFIAAITLSSGQPTFIIMAHMYTVRNLQLVISV